MSQGATPVERPRIAVTSEFRVDVDPQLGAVTPSPFGHDYWRDFFGLPLRTTLVVRAEPAAQTQPSEQWRAVAGPDVQVVALPPLRPSLRLVSEIPRALRTLWRLEPGLPVVLRMPGIVSTLALLVLACRRAPFAVQVVGDPVDVAFNAGIGGRLAPVVGVVLGGATWLACKRAEVVAYVTEDYLQRRYQARRGARVHAFSNVRLDGRVPMRRESGSSNVQLVTVGSLEQPYKRVDLLLEALAALRGEGWVLTLEVAGEGAQLQALRGLAERLGVHEHVRFRGMVDTVALQALLAQSDLFVLGSDTEGMPRALIEAMAAGLPCVATAVGGIPELLPAHALCRPGSLDSLVGALRRNLVSPQLRRLNAAMCREATERFRPEVLDRRRDAFVHDVTRLSSRDGMKR